MVVAIRAKNIQDDLDLQYWKDMLMLGGCGKRDTSGLYVYALRQ